MGRSNKWREPFDTQITDLSCKGSICMCNENDSIDGSLGLHQRLQPAAITVLILISGGFPLLLLGIIMLNLDNIKIDQILRAYDVDMSVTASLSRIKEIRERYHKIYYYFKPGKVYWITYIVIDCVCTC